MSPAQEQLARELNATHAAWCAARGKRERDETWKNYAARRRWARAVTKMHREGSHV